MQIPRAQKRCSSHQCIFALLGSDHVQGAHKTMVKSTPGVGVHEWGEGKRKGLMIDTKKRIIELLIEQQ